MNSKSTNNFFNFSERADLTAIIKSDESIFYKDLFTRANKLSSSLLDFGINKNDYIPLLIEDNSQFIKTTIALWHLGAVPVPLNTKLINEEVYSIVDDYDLKFLVTDKELPSGRFQKDFKIIQLNEIQFNKNEFRRLTFPVLEDEAVVIFTSGISGTPKGVVHTFSSLINSIENGSAILNHKENDRWLASLPFYHIGGFQIICRSLYYGCSIIIPESLQTKQLADAILTNKPTHLSLVSTQLERLIHQKVKPKESLMVTLIGG